MGIKATHSNLQTPSTSPTGSHSTMSSGFVMTCDLGQFGVDHIRTLMMETVSFRNVGLLTHNVSVHSSFIYKLCVHVIPISFSGAASSSNPCIAARSHHTVHYIYQQNMILTDLCKTHLPSHLACLLTCAQTCYLVG